MGEQPVERDLQRSLAGRARRDVGAEEIHFQPAMLVGIELHRIDREFRADDRIILPGNIGLLRARQIVIVTGEHPRQVGDVGLRIGLDRLAGAIGPDRAVGLQLVEPDREELHDLAGVILVRLPARRRILLRIAFGIEIHAHPGIERDALQQGAEIAERLVAEQVPIGAHHIRRPEAVDRVQRHHEELRQGEGAALPHLVGLGEQLVPDHVIAGLRPEIARLLGDRIVAAGSEPIHRLLPARLAEAGGEPCVITLGADGADVRWRGAELRPHQEARGLGIGDRGHARRRPKGRLHSAMRREDDMIFPLDPEATRKPDAPARPARNGRARARPCTVLPKLYGRRLGTMTIRMG